MMGGQGSGYKCIRAHLHRFLHADLQAHSEIRDAIIGAFTMEDAEKAIAMVKELYENEGGHDVSEEQLSWYIRHRTACDQAEKKRDAYIEEKKDTEEEEEECPVMCFGEVCGEDDGDY